MLYAALAQCPVFGGRSTSADESAIAGRAGVRRVVKFDDAVAVVADSWWQAKKALDALPVAWDDGPNGAVIERVDRGDARAPGSMPAEAGVGREDGDVAAAWRSARRAIAADYHVPYLAHATLEPQNCTAHVVGDQVEIWVPTQHGESALAVAATAAGVPPRNVVVHKMMLGGGFGRRGIVQDFIPHAVKIAKAVGRRCRPSGRAKRTCGTTSTGPP